LVTVVSASLALLLRVNMPEPLEMIASAKLALEEDEAEEAAVNGKGAVKDTKAVADMAARLRHRIPFAELMRHHLLALALHALVACFSQASVCE